MEYTLDALLMGGRFFAESWLAQLLPPLLKHVHEHCLRRPLPVDCRIAQALGIQLQILPEPQSARTANEPIDGVVIG